MAAKFSSPPAIVWVMVLMSFVFLGTLGFYPSALQPGEQEFFRYIIYILLLVHVAEAIFAYVLASRSEQKDSALKWALQTFICGFFSFRLLLKKTR